MKNELWMKIPGHEGYLASSFGRIWSNKSNRILRSTPNTNGYLTVGLCYRGNRKTVRVHVLVLISFVGSRPLGYEAAHLNGLKKDNRLDNLAFVTKKENAQQRVRHGTQASRERHGSAKLTEQDVVSIRESYVFGGKTKGTYALAQKFNVSQSTIHRLIRGYTWRG